MLVTKDLAIYYKSPYSSFLKINLASNYKLLHPMQEKQLMYHMFTCIVQGSVYLISQLM